MTPTGISNEFPLVRRLKDPSEAEIARVVTVLKDAFGDDDPFTQFLVGGDMSLVPLELGANVRSALVGGEIFVACVGPEPADIVGAAIWYGPGQSVMRTEEQRAGGWNEFLEKIPDDLRKWWLDYFIPTMQKLPGDALGADFSLQSWHMHLFGVVPEHQRKGLGKALVKACEELAKEDLAPMVLETTSEIDVHIYKRLGFKVITEIKIVSPKFGESPMVLMAKMV